MPELTDTDREIEDLRKRLAEMTAEASNNETILKRTQARELTLLRADSLSQLLHAMVSGLRESYALDAVSSRAAIVRKSSSRFSSSTRWSDWRRSSPSCTSRGLGPMWAPTITCCFRAY
jgi:uncharacterized protein YigA (DUF484 family)